MIIAEEVVSMEILIVALIGLIAFMHMLWKYIKIRITLEALMAHMIDKNQMPTEEEIRKRQEWVIKKRLGVNTDGQSL